MYDSTRKLIDKHQVERRIDGGASITGEAALAIPCNCTDDSGRIYLSNALILPIGDINITLGIDNNTPRHIQTRFTSGPPSPVKAPCPFPATVIMMFA